MIFAHKMKANVVFPQVRSQSFFFFYSITYMISLPLSMFYCFLWVYATIMEYHSEPWASGK